MSDGWKRWLCKKLISLLSEAWLLIITLGVVLIAIFTHQLSPIVTIIIGVGAGVVWFIGAMIFGYLYGIGYLTME
ncbi:hypothetical protein DRN85_06670 [Methanosarcinales archaeon]|nr:MAG: hypothetical protein DRN85_06670 [Methanosarcinales archaeon]